MKKNNRTSKSAQPTRQNKVVRGRPTSAYDYDTQSIPLRSPAASRKRKKKKGRTLKRIVLAFFAILLVLGGLFLFVYSKFQAGPLNRENLSINSQLADKYGGKVKNIALFGVDTRDPNDIKGRSDAIMILSIDQKNGVFKLTSILRDSCVSIDGHGEEKITHAYAYGGPELAVKTLNQNFGMDIEDYAAVNFSGFSSIVDTIGGIELEISEAERKQINKYANEGALSAPEITEPGLVRLTGAQATAYARIRKIDSDNARAERQKKVLECVLQEMKSVSPTKYPALIDQFSKVMETSMNPAEVLVFAPMMTGEIELDSYTIPSEEDNAVGGNYKGHWVWRFDLEAASDRLHKFIYE